MHPFMLQEIAKGRQEDILRAARGLGPLPEWDRAAGARPEKGRVRSALARPVLRLALALLGDEGGHLRTHLAERSRATC